MSTGSDVSILLVEDDECIRLVTTAVLRTIGYTNVSFAGNGEEAVRVCAEKLFDVILMDCEMPVMNGMDATRNSRALGVRTPIIAYTASVESGNKSRCTSAGMDDFLTKPASPVQLAKKLHLWLTSHPRG
jgi:CheY-like chemotaxis protein